MFQRSIDRVPHPPRSLRVILISPGTTIVGKATATSSEFLGITYATAERWGLPVDVELADLPQDTIVDAAAFGHCCLQVPAVYAPNQAEACQNLNVYAPAAADAPATPDPDSNLDAVAAMYKPHTSLGRKVGAGSFGSVSKRGAALRDASNSPKKTRRRRGR